MNKDQGWILCYRRQNLRGLLLDRAVGDPRLEEPTSIAVYLTEEDARVALDQIEEADCYELVRVVISLDLDGSS